MKIFKLPDLGEGLPNAEISEWHVKIGDVVKLDQPLVSMETAKAVVEVPSPFTGKVVKLYGNAGDLIQTGSPLVEFESEENKTVHQEHPTANNAATAAGEIKIGSTVIEEQATALTTRSQGGISRSIKITPAIRALASQMKVDLANVIPTGPNGTVTRQDIEQAAAALKQAGPMEPLKGVRRAMAQSMSLSQAEVVSVTVMDDAKLLNWSQKQDITVRIIQATVAACKAEPALNAWFDFKMMGRWLLKDIQLGLAMDTEDGLFVPVIRNAQTLNAEALRAQIEIYKKQVAERSIAPEDLRGATLTLTNFGKFAGRYANPVVVPPMVAILGVGKLREEALVVQGEIRVGKLLPLALTFDHRVVTGGEATRFLGVVIQALETNINVD